MNYKQREQLEALSEEERLQRNLDIIIKANEKLKLPSYRPSTVQAIQPNTHAQTTHY